MTDAPAAPAQPSLRLILTSLLQADLLVLVKTRTALVLSLMLPLLLLFTTRSDKASHRLGGSVFVVGLCMTVGLLSTSIVGYALTVARDREQGVFQRLRVTPAPAWAIMASRLAVQVLANLLIALVVLVVGSAVHHLTLDAGQYVLVLLVANLGGAVFLSIGQALVGLLRSATTVEAGARILMMVLLLSGLLGASGALGDTVASITTWGPFGTVITLFTAILGASGWSSKDTLSLLACCGYIAVFAGAGIHWFRWDAR
ncbi:MAG: ABC transporter permease [Candidatus Dormibacteria bacterium]